MLNKIKSLLGISDDTQDDLLDQIIDLTEARLKLLLGETVAVPDSLSYIVVEVSVRRFNRIGSEGLASHTVEGETMSWPDNDFSPYLDDIQVYLDSQPEPSTSRGRVKFL